MALWSLTSLQLKLIKIGARVVRHARAIAFQLAEVVVSALMVRANGLLEPTAIRNVRQKRRLSQKQAGALIGGGPHAFQKYGAGDVLISKSADTALRLLANDPSRLDELAARQTRAAHIF